MALFICFVTKIKIPLKFNKNEEKLGGRDFYYRDSIEIKSKLPKFREHY